MQAVDARPGRVPVRSGEVPPGMLSAEPEGLLAVGLLARALVAGPVGLVFVARSETRAARLHRMLAALAPAGCGVWWLPGWDCLPYDRASPSRAVMGRRMALPALVEAAEGPRLLVVSAEAAAQKLPAGGAAAALRLRAGAALDLAALRRDLLRLGYRLDDEAEEPGEAAVQAEVADLCLPDGAAWRLRVVEGRLESLGRLDPLSQRSLDEAVAALDVPAASELLLAAEDPLLEARPAGLEHLRLGDDPLVAPLALLPKAAVLLDEGAEAALAQRWAELREAFQTRLALRPPREGEPPLPPPEARYLDAAGWAASLGGRQPEEVGPADAGAEALPRFLAEAEPEPAFLAHAEAVLAGGRRLAVAGGERAARRLLAALRRPVQVVADWPALLALPPGSLALLPAAGDLPGLASPEAVLVPLASVRPEAGRGGNQGAVAFLAMAASLQPGDAVIHAEHGLAALAGVEAVAADGVTLDYLRLEQAHGSRLVRFDEVDRLWRYGAEAAGLTLDRMEGGGWPRRRAEAEAAVAATAEALAGLLRAREAAKAPVLRPPAGPYARLAGRFPYEPTPDQAAAIAETLADLASGRPMDRLVCGDVGFGKTEVAIRAAAAAALSGKQVALLAPTTVLVRQHLEGFRRRFAGLGLRIEALSRLTPAGEAREIRAAIARGEVQIAIGTQALVARGVRFSDLGLLVVDEEQRFGARQKAGLAALRQQGGLHVLTLTATPIPRTLQAALVGLRALSVIATAPALRQPVRTLRAPLDDALLAQALRREVRRGGQGFVVCPRIEDIAPMRARLAALLPELDLVEAHGGMPPAEMDQAMVGFAAGEGDVLLSTNIVEAGLDVPRANTMLVWRADRFGLAQLHQLRGRVGRGRARGVVYLLTDPAAPPGAATLRRLRTLEALDRVGAGFAISARDLDLRGAGEMVGEAQAGHLRLVGIELYAHLLDRALAAARGEAAPEPWTPALSLGLDAGVPAAHVPAPALRVELHARLGRLLRAGDLAGVAALEDEAEDRFGEPPEALRNLFALARLALRCRRLGVARLEVGPAAVAATLRAPGKATPPGLERKGERLLLRQASATPEERLAAAEALLAALRPGRSG